MNLANMTKDDLLRHSAFRLRENAKSRGVLTVDHADCLCGGHGAPAAQATADQLAEALHRHELAAAAKTGADIARMNAFCRARSGKVALPPSTRAAPGFTADAHPGTPGATGPGRYWTPASINTAAAGAWPKRSAA